MACFRFCDLGDGTGDFFVDAAFQAVELLLAILHSKHRHLGRAFDVVTQIGGGVPGDQAGLQSERGQFFGGLGSFTAAGSFHGSAAVPAAIDFKIPLKSRGPEDPETAGGRPALQIMILPESFQAIFAHVLLEYIALALAQIDQHETIQNIREFAVHVEADDTPA